MIGQVNKMKKDNEQILHNEAQNRRSTTVGCVKVVCLLVALCVCLCVCLILAFFISQQNSTFSFYAQTSMSTFFWVFLEQLEKKH